MSNAITYPNVLNLPYRVTYVHSGRSQYMTFYCTTHKEEDLQALQNEELDSMTAHMVRHRSYDLQSLRESIKGTNQVIWLMQLDYSNRKYRFIEILD